ncbi:DUF4229 domain-containing protein [Pseudonocardia xishanensis]|uniref:DUF4229 domain-containing protein n=1 Tax=Pseudonocardia xishanensis TaxID=630995 RepID=A0ABP8S399_9PSEU
MSAGTDTRREPGLAATIALYTVARLALVALIAALLALAGVPVLLAVLIGLIVALPLSMVLFRGLRARLDRALAVTGERRGAQREALRAGLRGEAPAASGARGSAAEPAEPAAASVDSDREAQPEPDRRQD